MPRRLIKRYLPAHHELREHKYLRHFGDRLHDPNLWHLNRQSVAGGVAVGIFTAFIPAPFQMVIAAAGAILFRVNLPLAVLMVWISNPLTLPPLVYFTYKLGSWLLNSPHVAISFEWKMQWLASEMHLIWKPLLLGGLLTGSVLALLSSLLIRFTWGRYVLHRRRKRLQAARRSSS